MHLSQISTALRTLSFIVLQSVTAAISSGWLIVVPGHACSAQEGYELNDAEVRQAVQLLDKNSDGLISFDEFVDWWVNQVSLQPKP